MSIKNSFYLINLQLFAEGSGTGDGGATGATETAAVSQKGEKNSLADVKYGVQEGNAQTADVQVTAEASPDRNAEFDKLIKGEYKDIYNAKMENAIKKRFASTKETVDRYNALAPTLELLAKKYGVDVNDAIALNKAIEDDDTYFEEEALEKGITVEQLKEFRKIEKENAELKRQMEEENAKQNASKIYAKWMEQAESAKAVYPSFDLQTEMQNSDFINLLKSNVDVRTAYEVLHKDEIIPAAMQFTAKKVEQQLTNKIIANGARPTENGINSQSASLVKSDVSQLSKADIDEISRRVARGEKISFG